MHRAVASLRARFVTPFRVLGLLGISLCLVFAPIEDVQANEKSNQVSSAKGQRKASKKTAASAKSNKARKQSLAARKVDPRPSVGHLAGLHLADDPLDLKSSLALGVDQDTQEVLFSK
ncbi:MAG: peptidase S11, partial [Hylemonella sp.]